MNRHDDDGPSVMAINFSQKTLMAITFLNMMGWWTIKFLTISPSPSIYKNPSKSGLLSKNRGFFLEKHELWLFSRLGLQSAIKSGYSDYPKSGYIRPFWGCINGLSSLYSFHSNDKIEFYEVSISSNYMEFGDLNQYLNTWYRNSLKH